LDFPLFVTPELIIIGGLAASITELLRGLFLRWEDHPRIRASWKFLPSALGVVLIFLIPSVIPPCSPLIMLAHGASSPALFAIAYPLLKKARVAKVTQLLKDDATPAAPPLALPTKEGDP